MRAIATVIVFALCGPVAAGLPERQEPSVADVNARFVREIAAEIKGREEAPAAKVFKNIRIPWFRSTPAAQFLDIMEDGYAKALGVRCTHCHDEHDFASDQKRPKRAAREMAAMHRQLNRELLKMKNLKGVGDERVINCATCHRGAVDPHDPAQ